MTLVATFFVVLQCQHGIAQSAANLLFLVEVQVDALKVHRSSQRFASRIKGECDGSVAWITWLL